MCIRDRIDGFSGRLIPSQYTEQEREYLENYSKSIRDGKMSDNERSLLVTLASAYGIDDDRVKEIEASFVIENSTPNTPESDTLAIPGLEVTKQWTDDSGYTWRKMSDGSTQWWSGNDWQDYA